MMEEYMAAREAERMPECADWREAWKPFEGIDFENEADALRFIDRMNAFRDSIDLEGLSRQAEAKICPEKGGW